VLSPTGFPITPACMMTPMSTHYAGVGVSRGAAAGPVVRVVTPAPPPREEAGQVDVEAEIERAQEALAAVATELEDLAHKVGATGAVLVAQARIARDPALLAMVSESVRSHRRAGRAIYDTLAAYRDMRAADPLRPVPPQAELESILLGKSIDAFAINRQRGLDAQSASGGKLRPLPDTFLDVDQCFVVEKGATAKLKAIEPFVSTVRQSGFINASIERAKLTGVSPARK